GPLPPLAEQHRIVAKVEELLALCDQLETHQTAVREHRTRVVHSALDHLTAAKDEQDFRNRASFILHKSPFVLDDVSALRQPMLSLSVHGRLVPQNATDEPAPAMLRKPLPLPAGYERRPKRAKETAIALPEHLFIPLPHSWKYARVQELY